MQLGSATINRRRKWKRILFEKRIVLLKHISREPYCWQFPAIKLDLDAGQFLSLMNLLKGSLAAAVALGWRLLGVPWDFSTCSWSCSRRRSRTCATSLAHRPPSGFTLRVYVWWILCTCPQIDMSWVRSTARVLHLLLADPRPQGGHLVVLPRASD